MTTDPLAPKADFPLSPVSGSRRFIAAMTAIILTLGCDTAIQILTWPSNAQAGSPGISVNAVGVVSSVALGLILGLAWQKVKGGGHA